MNFYFNSYKTNSNKTAFRSLVNGKQAFFKRLVRRYNASQNPSERTFLKAEAARVITQLRTCAAQWKKNHFGNATWITRGYQMNCLTTRNHRSRRNHSTRRTTRSTSRSRRSPVARHRRSNRSTRTRSYVAW